jgi:uncharacterized protein (TIGR03437 family)
MAGQALPLFFVSPQQINFLVPWELEGLASATLQVSVGGVPGNTQSVLLTDYSPGIFTIDSGTGQGMVIGDSGQNAAPVGSLPGAQPVQRGKVISIYSTGLGPVSHPPTGGAPASADPLSITLTFPTVTLGDTTALEVFAALAPGSAGSYQVKARIPEDAPTGDAVPLSITIGNFQSNTVTIAVQ